MNKNKIERQFTSSNLLGINRKMAHTNKKYYSGWICIGVTKGLAKIKFSGLPAIFRGFENK